MLWSGLVVHKSFGWNILSLTMIYIMIIFKIFCDNTNTIHMTKNANQHSKTKHIKIWYHSLRYHYDKGDIEIDYVFTDFQLADIFTKSLDYNRFSFICGELNVCVMELWRNFFFNYVYPFWCMTKRGRKS